MAIYTLTALKALDAIRLGDNTSAAITPAVMRQVMIDTQDSTTDTVAQLRLTTGKNVAIAFTGTTIGGGFWDSAATAPSMNASTANGKLTGHNANGFVHRAELKLTFQADLNAEFRIVAYSPTLAKELELGRMIGGGGGVLIGEYWTGGFIDVPANTEIQLKMYVTTSAVDVSVSFTDSYMRLIRMPTV